jgi:hypothetical protein
MMMNTFYRQSSIGLLGSNNDLVAQNPSQVVGMGGTFYCGFGSQSSLGLKQRKNVMR